MHHSFNLRLYHGQKVAKKLKLSNLTFIEEEKDRREGKGRRFWLGDVLECRTSHLAARMILRKVLGRTSILEGWWFVVWCGGEPENH